MKRKRMVLTSLLLALALFMGTALAYEELPVGSQGEEVRQMQQRLTELGYYERSIDGDFGALSQRALRAFQSANGLERTGKATPDVLEKLYSDAARPIPPKPDVEVTAVKYRSSSVRQTVTLHNHLSEPVDSVVLRYITLDREGRFEPEYSLLPKDFSSEQSAYTDEIVRTIQPGKISSAKVDVLTGTHELAVGVSEYRTASGRWVRLSTEQITYRTSEGDVIYPTEDPQAYTLMSDEDYTRARGIMFGYTSFVLPAYARSNYLLPPGMYVVEVNPDSIAHMAGLAVGDVVTAIDGVSGTAPYCAELAKLKMLDGESAALTYWRNNRSHETLISLDMEQPESAEAPAVSVADELLKYAELLEKGLLTQEEYDLLKQQLLGL